MGTAASSRDQAALLRAKDTRAVSRDPPTLASFTLSRAGGGRARVGPVRGRVGTCVVWGEEVAPCPPGPAQSRK